MFRGVAIVLLGFCAACGQSGAVPRDVSAEKTVCATLGWKVALVNAQARGPLGRLGPYIGFDEPLMCSEPDENGNKICKLQSGDGVEFRYLGVLQGFSSDADSPVSATLEVSDGQTCIYESAGGRTTAVLVTRITQGKE